MRYLALMVMGVSFMHGITAEKLTKILQATKAPFSYDLGIKIFPNRHKRATIMICCHGYGANNHIADAVHSTSAVLDHIVSFNFPDYDCVAKQYDPKKNTFGSINELLPLFYILKKCVIDAQQEKINLYIKDSDIIILSRGVDLML